MRKKLTTESLPRGSALRPKRVIAAWLVILIAAVIIFGSLFSDAVTTEFNFLSDADSKEAEALLAQRLEGTDLLREVVVVRSSDFTVDDPAYRRFVQELSTSIMALGPDVVFAGSDYFGTNDESLVSSDRHSTILPLVMAGDLKHAESSVELIHSLLDDNVKSNSGLEEFRVFITGEATFSKDFVEGSQKDLETGEKFAVPIAMIILAVVFGALAATALPMALSVASIAIAMGLVAVLGIFFESHVFVQNIITMIGLAVGIDYSLFVVSRFLEERARGLDKIDAIGIAGATASRAVLFSGMTVVLSLTGLLLVPLSVFVSVGAGAIIVVTVAVLASVTLLPALLSIMGDRVNKFQVPFLNKSNLGGPNRVGENGRRGIWDRVALAVMRRPAVSLLLAGGLLAAAAIPYFSINTGNSGASSFPEDFRSRQGFEVLQAEFGFGANAPAEVVIDGDIASPEVQDAIASVRALLLTDEIFGAPQLEANDAGDLALLSVPLKGDSLSEDTIEAIRTLRDEILPQAFAGVPAAVVVGGVTADAIDFIDTAESYQPLVIGFVLGLSFLLLMLVFRSIVIPAKAIILNLLSVGAAYGLLVLVFQKGVGNELFGFAQVDVIQSWIPLMLFAILFGLSMDYHVFLLSRIRERFLQTGDNTESVAFGLRTTGGLITGAALIMVAVFAGFAAGDLVQMQQFGFGMAVAILLDATIVRTVLVPASMKLLASKNWYLPGFLRWLPDVGIEGGSSSSAGLAANGSLTPQPAGGDD